MHINLVFLLENFQDYHLPLRWWHFAVTDFGVSFVLFNLFYFPFIYVGYFMLFLIWRTIYKSFEFRKFSFVLFYLIIFPSHFLCFLYLENLLYKCWTSFIHLYFFSPYVFCLFKKLFLFYLLGDIFQLYFQIFLLFLYFAIIFEFSKNFSVIWYYLFFVTFWFGVIVIIFVLLFLRTITFFKFFILHLKLPWFLFYCVFSCSCFIL